jgi:HD superfamily phosphohydrolase
LERIRQGSLAKGIIPRTEEELGKEQRVSNEIELKDWNTKWSSYIDSISDPAIKQKFQSEYERLRGLIDPSNPFDANEMSAIVAKIKSSTPDTFSYFNDRTKKTEENVKPAALSEGNTAPPRLNFRELMKPVTQPEKETAPAGGGVLNLNKKYAGKG